MLDNYDSESGGGESDSENIATTRVNTKKTVVSSDYEEEYSQYDDDTQEEDYDDDYSDSDSYSDPDDEVYGKSKKTATSKRLNTRNSHDSESDDDDYYASRPKSFKKTKSRGKKTVNSGIVSDDDLSEDSESDEEIKADKMKSKVQPTGIIPFQVEAGSERIVDSIADWNAEKGQVLVKWKGKSYRWATWCPIGAAELSASQASRRKLENFLRKIEEEQMESEDGTSLTLETLRYNLELNYPFIERIVAMNTTRDRGSFYLCKWRGLGYAECTWEWEGDVRSWEGQEAIDAYLSRQYASNRPTKSLRRREGPFAKITIQPAYFPTDLQLRDYQMDGLNWLLYSWTRHVNVILADEMGLGKTIQSVCFLKAQQEEFGFTGPSLVVVPLSTIDAWQREFARWTGNLNVVVYVGDAESRAVTRNYEFGRFHVLLTTYELVLKDQAVLSQVKWRQLMVDEGHRLKNSSSQLYEVLYTLVPSSGFRVLITGTPLQNSLGELWCLLRFLMPDKFTDYDEFLERYDLSTSNDEDDCISDQDRLAELHALIKPHILRRLKRDVEKSLPGKTERIIRVDLSPLQRQLYRHILTRNYRDLKKTQEAAGNRVSGSLINILGELKKICNHPLLLGTGSPNAQDEVKDAKSLVQESGKLELLQRMLQKLKKDGHRVLIFSQSVKMLDILSKFLRAEGYSFQRLDGSTSSAARHHSITAFNAADSNDFCFLLSTRAGGLGINLATADTVIIYDSDWNPQNDLQAMARAHRIGQKRQVSIYRLVSANTVEEKILERAKRKMVLDHLVIQKLKKGESAMASSSQAAGSEVQAILKFGAQALFSNETPAVPASAIDLDALMAETAIEEDKEAAGEEEEEDDEFLGRFRIADLGVSNGTGAASWDEIIPEDERKRAEEEAAREETLKRELELQEALLTSATGRRSRKQPTENVSKEKPAPKNDSSNDLVLFPSGGEAEALTYEEESKFGICKSDALEARLNELLASGKELPSHFKVIPNGPLQKASLPGLLERIKGLAVLRKDLLAFKSLDESNNLTDFSSFRHSIVGIKAPANWSFTGGYSVQQDSLLLVAVGLFGYGNWMRIKNELGALNASWLSLASPQIVRRVDYLLKELQKAQEKRKKPAPVRKQKSPPPRNEDRERELIEKFRKPFKPVRNCFLELDNLKQQLESANADATVIGATLTSHLRTLGDFVISCKFDARTERDAWDFIATFWPLQDRSSGPELKQMYAKIKK